MNNMPERSKINIKKEENFSQEINNSSTCTEVPRLTTWQILLFRKASLNFFHFRNKYLTSPPPPPQDFWAKVYSRKISKILSRTAACSRSYEQNSYLIGGKSLTSYSPDCRTSVSRASFPVQGRSARRRGSFRSCASARNARPLDDGRLSFAVKENREINREFARSADRIKKKGERCSRHDTSREESQTVSIGRPTSNKNNSTIVRAIVCFSFIFFSFIVARWCL